MEPDIAKQAASQGHCHVDRPCRRGIYSRPKCVPVCRMVACVQVRQVRIDQDEREEDRWLPLRISALTLVPSVRPLEHAFRMWCCQTSMGRR